MPDIAAIASALTSIKTATDIVKLFRETDITFEKAEQKLKLAELIDALAETKISLSEVQDIVREKDSEITQLRDALETKATVVRFWDGIYFATEAGKPNGDPHCLRCWNEHHKLRELVQAPGEHGIHVCASCKAKYSARLCPRGVQPSDA